MLHITLDIETAPASEETILNELAHTKAPSNYGKTAAEKFLKEKGEKMRSKPNLVPSAPINVLGLLLDDNPLLLTTFPELEEPLEGVATQHFESEEILLQASQIIFDNLPFTDLESETVLITYNGMSFDLPKIKCRMAYYNIKIPLFLHKAYHYDVMVKFNKYFNVEHNLYDKYEKYIKADKVFRRLGVNGKKIDFEEAQQEFLDKGDYRSFLSYNAVDILMTYECYKRMT